MIDVLVVEDSRVIRDYLVYVLESNPDIRVIATASNGEEALVSVKKHRPHVILMDIHMPGMDGFETTRRIMSSDPVPIVICTASIQVNEVHIAMLALEAGALAVLKKPRGLDDPEAESETAAIIRNIKMMSEVKMVRRWNHTPRTVADPGFADHPLKNPDGNDVAVIAIGASTGGPPVIMKIVSGLPPDFPAPILVVQHITVGFTAGFVEWLASTSRLPVHLANDGDIPLPGHVYVAPDNTNMRVGRQGELCITNDAPQNGLRPSVGILFRSVAERFGQRAVGILLTGMGKDGAEELKLMNTKGAITIAQDEKSSIVHGMPGEAIKLGAATHVLTPEGITLLLSSLVRTTNGDRR